MQIDNDMIRHAISTHSAREDGDERALQNQHTFNEISTHSAREDGDTVTNTIQILSNRFQPTPPARTETFLLLM